MGLSRFAKFAWILLFYNFLVIAWGAVVRATGSGDGCGNDWPTCSGLLLLTSGDVEHTKTWIEYAHRMSTAVLGPAILVLAIWALRKFPKKHPVRLGVFLTTFFTIVEALIGALLVRRGWVADDASAERAIVMSLHLVNTFFLLGSITVTALWASGIKPPRLKGQGSLGAALLIGFVGMLLLGVSGAVSALGDTLFAAETVAIALKQDFSPTAHFLERLRPLHPLLAISVGIYLMLVSGLIAKWRPSEQVSKAGYWVVGIFLFQVAFGLANLLANAPIWMQIVHLFIADILWVSFVILGAYALSTDAAITQIDPVDVAEVVSEPRSAGVMVKQYIALTKPRVISLLLFTTLTALFAAKGGWPGWLLLISVAVGGYMAAGAANAINMVIDRDIDGTMKRTAKRPTVTQNISSANALLFGFALAAGSVAILWAGANLLSALMAMAGLAFYVVIYTLMLKRRTWHNIVIGGAAGAFPPLVGWAAGAGEISPLAWLLFAIIFVWTPVHFWALALLIKDDYARAGVPMLPVVHGERVTVIQIGLYAILTAIVSSLPVLQPSVGWPYFIVAAVLNVVLLFRCVQLYQQTDRPRAVTLYKFSMVYLALLFLTFAIDRAWWS